MLNGITKYLGKVADNMRKEAEMERNEKEKEARIDEERKKLNERLDSLDRFPGNLQDYCGLKNRKYEIIDSGAPIKEVLIDPPNCYPWKGREEFELDTLRKLVESGCEGFIYYNHKTTWRTVYGHCGGSWTSHSFYGVPVRSRQ